MTFRPKSDQTSTPLKLELSMVITAPLPLGVQCAQPF